MSNRLDQVQELLGKAHHLLSEQRHDSVAVAEAASHVVLQHADDLESGIIMAQAASKDHALKIALESDGAFMLNFVRALGRDFESLSVIKGSYKHWFENHDPLNDTALLTE